jgi:hypothetical protein
MNPSVGSISSPTADLLKILDLFLSRRNGSNRSHGDSQRRARTDAFSGGLIHFLPSLHGVASCEGD